MREKVEMIVPQYKINVHVASVLSNLGLPIRAEEPFYTAKKKRIPDFIINHSTAGAMIGEAEIGTNELDPGAIGKLVKRVHDRFKDTTFKGYDYIALFIYPRSLVEEAFMIPESKIEKTLMEKTVGLGIAIRGDAFQLKEHYIRWYCEPIKIINIPQTLDILISEFFRTLRSLNPNIKMNAHEIVESIINIIENTSHNMSLMDNPDFIEKLANSARKLNIAWDRIKKPKDRIGIATKFIMLMSTLVMIFYETVRNERLCKLKPLECDKLSLSSLIELFEKLIIDEETSKPRYSELNAGFIKVLKEIPEHIHIDAALRKICKEIKNNYVTMRRMGWDILSMLYQRLLSETYRHAFATFYTKLPAARLLASLAIEKFDDKVLDPASGTGSLLLASLERRRSLLVGKKLKDLYKKSLETERPLLDLVNETILSRTVGLDALKPACFIAALNLRIATQGSPPSKLDIYNVPVSTDRGGSLDILVKQIMLPENIKRISKRTYDVVIMNPPFTRSDRISLLMGKDIRKLLSTSQLYFGGTRVRDIFAAGMAKPFMVLADKLVKNGGRIAAVLPNSILSRPSWKDIRKELTNSYSIEYIVISWAPGTPNFSSDTYFREILLVARKKESSSKTTSLKIINLLKRIDDLRSDEIDALSRKASRVNESVLHVTSDNDVIATIVSVNLEKEIRKRLEKMGFTGNKLRNKLKEELERLSDNLYRLIAFRSGDLLRLHLDIIVRCSTRFSDVFNIGSVIDHTSGLTKPVRRDKKTKLLHETPALWGSGRNLNVNTPRLERTPFKIGVTDETSVKVKYWKQPSQRKTFYSARIFVPRKVQLDTQYVLMVLINEDAISNVWWPLRPRDSKYAIPYLVYMNSVFGFINFLGERLETRGLYMEIKKQHLENMPIPDLRRAHPIPTSVTDILRKPMPRFDEYIEFMAVRNENKPWFKVAKSVIEEAKNNEDIQLHANRAMLDLEAYKLLKKACEDLHVPNNLYKLLSEDIDVLQQIMERDDPDIEIIEDEVERVKKEVKHIPLDKWIR